VPKTIKPVKKAIATQEFDAKKPAGCPTCWSGGALQVTKKLFKYTGSSLGPFAVKDAVVYECPDCKNVEYLRSQARRWEMKKALEITLDKRIMRSREVVFLRSVLEETVEQLAKSLGVNKSTVSRWETKKITLQANNQLRDHFLLNVFIAVSANKGETSGIDMVGVVRDKLDEAVAPSNHLSAMLR
jgi:DNA-binding transcriptional regulator YiaG